MASSFIFQYLPLEGRLPGRDFEQQTEDVINGIGGRVVDLETSTAQLTTDVAGAYQAATSAQSTADSAYSIATNNAGSLSTLESALADISAIPDAAIVALFA